MARHGFTEEDLAQFADRGIPVDIVERQLELFKGPPPRLQLQRPCKVGDGIRRLGEEEAARCADAYETKGPARRCVKFVPASGAATRMFRALLRSEGEGEASLEVVERRADSGDPDAQDLLIFLRGIKRFAFFEALKSALSREGLDLERLMGEGAFTDILRLLLTREGLDYAHLPKGLILFHRYPDGSRTPLEEHLVEAAAYAMDQGGTSTLHFTVSDEHLGAFRAILARVQPLYEKRYKVSFHVTFSVQKASTDTIAVDLDNRPFRLGDGSLLFRPGGHGALIENLNDLRGDIIFVKNIDNVVPDRLKPETSRWKKVLAGYLLNTQSRVFDYVRRLSTGEITEALLEDITAFMGESLSLAPPASGAGVSLRERAELFRNRLHRPIRVCGMVRNVGEPGGGPFWVADRNGEVTPQIVESAQVDHDSEDQEKIWNASTHFNPVDLICGVRDWEGRPFDLKAYTDPDAVFISRKSKEGKDLKALEHPGLWNGAMSGWITLFVEVPLATFNPVKTVNDLLREEHQPA
jgi:hypothetical protein